MNLVKITLLEFSALPDETEIVVRWAGGTNQFPGKKRTVEGMHCVYANFNGHEALVGIPCDKDELWRADGATP